MPPFLIGDQSLQERLHTLLTRLSDTSEILQKWPETKKGDDASIHVRTTGKLIASIQRIIDGIKSLEEKVNHIPENENESEGGDGGIAKKLRQVAVPLDLLDMMDSAGGLNPDCFARGLIKEALRQMGNLQRRKASLKMLAATIQNGLDAREKQLEILKSLDEKLANHSRAATTTTTTTDTANVVQSESTRNDQAFASECHKRKRRDDDEQPLEEEPPSKR